MDIKRGTNTVVTVKPTGSQQRELMGKDVVNLDFTIGSFVALNVGDTITVYGNTYSLNRLPEINKVSSLQYDYSCQFEAEGYDLIKVQYLMLDNSGAMTVPDFPLTGSASDFIDLIVSNMNRAYSGWSKGTVDDTDIITLSFSGDNCRSALTKVADKFKTEFWIDGQTIHFTKKGQQTALSFEYGKGKGLYSINKSVSGDKDVFSRLYAYGSTKNLPLNYRGGKNRLQLAAGYIQKTEQFAAYGLIEVSKIWEDIYPHRTGTISAVTDEFTFSDSGMDFDLNDQLVEGVTAKVVFKTGDLAGYEFTVSKYDAGTKTFTILENQDEKAFKIPSEDLKPALGDKYTIVDINMPQSYIDAAEAELQTAANAYYDENSNGRELYAVDCDPIYFRNQNIDSLNVGDFVTIKDGPMGIERLIRIIGIERDLELEYKYNLTLADTATIAAIVREYFEQQNNRIIIQRNRLNDVNTARRNWRNTADLEDLVFDPEGHYYTEKIKPKSIETLYLAAGAKAQNYSLNGVIIKPNFQADENELQVTAGQLVHYTLEIEGVGSVWEMESASFSNLDPDKAYYLFARVSTTALTGTWKLLEAPIEVDSETGYWNLGVGVLFAVEDGYRSFEFNKGMTYIVGDTIKTGKIQSMDANTYFNLTQGILRATNPDQTSGIDVNGIRPGLTILGGLVQNAGGATSEIGLFRGIYDPGKTYYKGDIVIYNGSTYRWISLEAGQGVTPGSDAFKWQLYAAKGKSAVRIIYKASDYAYDAPDLNLLDSDTQGWNLFNPANNLIDILATGDGDVIVTEDGVEIMLGKEVKYIWFSVEQLNEDGEFKAWTEPSRLTGVDGEKGKRGPTISYRGVYDDAKTYEGNDNKVEAVKYNGLYYFTRTDAGSFSGVPPTDLSKWEVFGAQFESIATGLLLAEQAYVANLIVSRISTSADAAKPRVVAKDGEIDIYDVDIPLDEETTSNAIIRIGKNAGIMNNAPNAKPGMRLRDIGQGGDASVSEISSEGYFSNGSGISFLPATAGIENNASSAFLLTKKNTDQNGISAAVVGIDQSGAGNSKSYGGYFNSLYVGALHRNLKVVLSTDPPEYTCTDDDYKISYYPAGGTTRQINLPANPQVSREVWIKSNADTVYISPNGNEIISTNGNVVTGRTLDKGGVVTYTWDGAYWLEAYLY